MTRPEPLRPPRRFALWIALGAACFWLIDLGLLRAGTPHPLDDIWEYGLVARSLNAGHGFRSSMLYPPLWSLRDGALTVPVLVHGPLLPLLGAPLLAAFGPGALDGAAWLAAAFALLAALFTARAVARHAGPAAGAVAAALVTASPIMIRAVHHDLAPAAGACFAALALDLVTRPRPPALAAGLALGCGALLRPELLLAAPCAAWVMGWRGLGAFAAGGLLPVVPWAAHTFAATGSPLFNLSAYLTIAYTRSHPGLSPLFDFTLPPSRWLPALVATLPELPAKWLQFGRWAGKRMLIAPAAGLGVVSALGAAAALRWPRTRRLAGAGLIVALIPWVVCTLTEPSERYLAVFLPLWAAAAVRGADAVAARLGRATLPRLALLAVLLPYAVMAMTREARVAVALRRWFAEERAALASRGAADLRRRLLFSDTPDFAAWTTGRPTVGITLQGYRALPREGEGRVPGDLPSPGEPRDEWFHADTHAQPAPARGGPADRADAARPSAAAPRGDVSR